MWNSRRNIILLVVTAFLYSPFTGLPQHGKEKTYHKEQKNDHNIKAPGFDFKTVIFDHILNKHEFHFMDIGHTPVSIALPVLLYSPERGWAFFSFSKFHHGHDAYNGYRYIDGKIQAVLSDGKTIDNSVRLYDLSITKNVVQMILAVIVFIIIMFTIARKYKKGVGVNSAPMGIQNVFEPIILFIRDEVVKPNILYKRDRFMPYLLTVFFFILINSFFGLIPGAANVTGNIAFTAILGIISFIVILTSSNKHFWMHIINPPGIPIGLKPLLFIVELLGVFTKPFALIIRLFANMLAGHIIIISLISIIFIFAGISKSIGWGFSPISVAFATFIYLIEILVAFIQAFIFTNLTAVFIGQSQEGAHNTEHH